MKVPVFTWSGPLPKMVADVRRQAESDHLLWVLLFAVLLLASCQRRAYLQHDPERPAPRVAAR
ncbi:hypothetical protein [Hymenobacter sp. B81]|uniref:hypothetical protein n=1 Tax=Hymenobacter sp. B81 TaxID=3344878 RepID=UPI0037DD3261